MDIEYYLHFGWNSFLPLLAIYPPDTLNIDVTIATTKLFTKTCVTKKQVKWVSENKNGVVSAILKSGTWKESLCARAESLLLNTTPT